MSTEDRWLRVKTLFGQALAQPDSERDAWLLRACAGDAELLDELSKLLTARATPPPMLAGEVHALLERLAPEDAGTELIGSNVGPYRITSLLGEGGMGRVYLAARADGQFSQLVALKLIRSEFATPEMQQRFLRERETLARLAHPNIAQLHDGGVSTSGAAYFTLEFIEGAPLTRWCDEHRLDIRARLQLMIKVCDAVQYAHRNLIVHRDLKPSNILVTAAGEPKLLDFGIAKLLVSNAASELTHTQATPMTREYAAPEQVLGDPVTTATDVYSLGVLLYLLLCGQMPYRRAATGLISWTKAVLEEMPEPMDRAIERPADTGDAIDLAAARATSRQTLKRMLRGDLERIVQRTLAKSPEGRYPTVSALQDDLRAYLDGRALSGGTRRYRMRKFVRRHWLPLVAATVVLSVIVVSAIGMAWEYVQIERQAATTKAVKDFVLGLFQNANPDTAQGKSITLRDAVDLGVERLDKIPANQPELKAELQNTLGTIYYQLGLYKPAADLHAQAFEALKSRPQQDAVMAIAAERFEATDIATLGDLAKAQDLAEDAVRRVHALSRPAAADIVQTLSTAAWIANRRKQNDRVKQLSEEIFDVASRPPVDDGLMAVALERKADFARRTNDLALAATYYKQALTFSVKAHGPDEQESLSIKHLLGSTLGSLGQYDEAQPYLQTALDSAIHSFGESNARSLRIGQIIAANEHDGGHVVEAEARYAHLLALAESHTPRDESVLTEIRGNYAVTLVERGQFDRAEPLLLAARDFLQAHPGNDPIQIAETHSTLGLVHAAAGKLDTAEADQRTALAILTSGKLDDIALVQARLSHVRLLRSDVDDALAIARQARDNALKVDGERSYDTADAHYYFGLALAAAKQSEQAESEWRAALDSYAQMLPPDGLHPASADVRLALGTLLADRPHDLDEGLKLINQAVTMRERVFGADDPYTQVARDVLVKAKNQR